jgi:hypothetical protein
MVLATTPPAIVCVTLSTPSLSILHNGNHGGHSHGSVEGLLSGAPNLSLSLSSQQDLS